MSKSGNKNSRKNHRINTKQNNKAEKHENKGKKKGFWKRHRKLALFIKLIIVLIILLIIIGAGVIVAIFSNDSWSLTKENLELNKDTIIYDKDGIEIANVSGDEKRRTVTLSEIPQYLQDAYISIEDERFYSHSGVDLKRTIGATIQYVLHKGSSSYGGSTITQQLVKNLMNDDADTGLEGIERKIREISRAYQLEQMLSKDQILELYLNLIYVGGEGNLHGVELASRYYFNKSVGDLDLAESAFLAGINNAPNSYNPFNGSDNTDLIIKRTKTVLSKMLELEKITQEEYDAAKQEVEDGLHFEKGETSTESSMSYLARAALNQVIKQFAEEKDVDIKTATTLIENGGYKIYTTEDSSIQSIMEDVYTSGDNIFYGVATKNGSLVNEGHTQSAMVIIDHKTGYVVGCMGGLGDDVNSNGQNRATQSVRQPGSAIKPIASIAPALEAGIITASTIYDESPTSFGQYTPTCSYEGLITVRKAIEISANTTEVKIMSELGPSNSIKFMRTLGISTLVTAEENPERNDESLAMVLGGITNGISPLEMAAAYAAIANDGVYISPTFYTRMEDSNGNIVLEPVQEKTRVMSEANAFILKSILTGPVTGANGTATSCKISGQATAGKTGTTSDNYDRWFCGFTSYYTAATWYGFDQPENLYTAGANSTNRAAKIWASIMKTIHADLPSASFEKPSNVTTATICLDSGKLATDSCTRTYTEYFVKGTVPAECEGHVTLTICKETGKIATEFCTDTEEVTYVTKPEKEDTTLWKTSDGGKYDIPEDVCDVHVKTVIPIPNVVGKTRTEATAELKKLGLVVTVEVLESSEAEGTVIYQSKAEGTSAYEGDTITITVSKKKTETSTNSEGSSNTQTGTNTIENEIESGNTTIDKPSRN